MLLIAALLLAGSAVPSMLQSPAASPSPAYKASQPTQDRTVTESNTIMVPQQVRKAEPPPPNASAEELEAIGDDLRVQKSFLDALDYYRAAMAKADSAVLRNKTGICDLLLDRFDAAKHEFERAIRMDRNYAEAYNNLGVVEYKHKKYGRAVKRYEQAIKINGDSAAFHSNLGTAFFGRKDYDKASAEYAKALQLDPDVFERHSRGGVSAQIPSAEDRAKYEYVIAKMYAGAGNPDRCLLYLRKAMEDGYSQISDVYKDREFTAVRKDPRFTVLMATRPAPITN